MVQENKTEFAKCNIETECSDCKLVNPAFLCQLNAHQFLFFLYMRTATFSSTSLLSCKYARFHFQPTYTQFWH